MSVESEFQRVGALIRQLQGALGGKAIRVGSGAWTFVGGTPQSNPAFVQHGLATVPSAVFVQTGNRFLQGDVDPADVTDTQFVTIAIEKDGNNVAAGTQGFYWIAIG